MYLMVKTENNWAYLTQKYAYITNKNNIRLIHKWQTRGWDLSRVHQNEA